MKLEIILVALNHALFVNCQKSFDDKFSPFLKIARLFLSDFVKPRSFDVGYQISQMNNVSRTVANKRW